MLRRITTVALALLASSAVSTGCFAPSPGPTSAATTSAATTSAATAAAAPPPTVVMVIRHGEKPHGADDGIDAAGNEDDSSLTETGWARAHRLVDLFDPTQGSARPGLTRPTAIYAAGANDDGEGARTRETVAPLAEHLGVTVNTGFGKGDEEALVEHVLAHPGTTLISWQHSGLPDIAAAFPAVTPAPPSDWPKNRFDVVWTFTRTADGWAFAQLPELVLPQDRAGVIGN